MAFLPESFQVEHGLSLLPGLEACVSGLVSSARSTQQLEGRPPGRPVPQSSLWTVESVEPTEASSIRGPDARERVEETPSATFSSTPSVC